MSNGAEFDIPAAMFILKSAGKIPPESNSWEWVDEASGLFRVVGCETLWRKRL